MKEEFVFQANEKETIREMEEAVICSLLIYREGLPEVTGWLTPKMFYTSEAAFIYEALLAQYNRGQKPDFLTTEAEMRKMDSARCQQMNGLGCLRQGATRIRDTGNLRIYGEEVRRHYLLRRLHAVFTSAANQAQTEVTDIPGFIAEVEQELLEIRKEQVNTPLLKPVGELAREILDFHVQQQTMETDQYVHTDLLEFDAITGGMHKGELYVGAGRPGDGKTAVAMQIAMNAAFNQKHVCLFSLEMASLQTMNRLFVGYAGVNPSNLRHSDLEPEEIEKMQQLVQDWNQLPFYLDYTPSNRVEQIRAQVLLQVKQQRCDLVIVDYLHLLETPIRRGETLEQSIGRNIRALKQLALEAECPILVLSQMNRASENRADKAHMPVLSDLRDSGTIEQVADCVFFVYRPDRHGLTEDPHTGEDLRGKGLLIVVKNRNGSTGKARFVYNSTFTRLTSPEK